MSLKNSKIIVIKIGSSLLVDEKKKIRKKWLTSFAKDIKKLKPHHQDIIQLRFFKELSYLEISQKTGIPINNVKVKLLRAKKTLATIIKHKK